MEEEKATLEERKFDSKKEKTGSRPFNVLKNGLLSITPSDSLQLNVTVGLLKDNTCMVGPTKFITHTNHGFWYTDEIEEETKSLPSPEVFNFGPSPVLCSKSNLPASSKKKNSSAKKATLTHARKLCKYLKTFIKGRTSFRNGWTILANFDLLEESYVKIQNQGFACNRSVLPPSFRNNFLQPSKLSSSISNFVRGTSCLTKVENPKDENLEVESVTSVSSAEIEIVEKDKLQTEIEKLEDSDSLRPDITKFFSSPEKESLCKSASIILAQEFVPFLAACDVELI